MLRERRGGDLEQWMTMAFHSGIAEWRPFVRKLRQDQAAVQAGLTLKWNNGPVEGHINRLKLLKRSMYGRAKFDLLRQRVLHRAEDNQKENETSRRVHMYKHSTNPVH